MMDPSPWRMNDVTLYDALRDEFRLAIASVVKFTEDSGGDTPDTIQHLRHEVYGLGGFDRAEVTARLNHMGRVQHVPVRSILMDDRPAMDATQVQHLILQALFNDVEPRDAPTFILLAGAAGAGAGRAIGQLRHEYGGDLVPVTVEDLQAFHPRYLDRSFRQSPAGQRELAQFAASWLQECISHARSSGYSLLLEGAFRSSETTLAVARLFADSGYHVRVVAVAASEDASLLTTTSRGLGRVQGGRAPQFVTPASNSQSIRAVGALVVAAADSPVVDRLSVLNRRGEGVFDAERSPSGMLAGASVALRAAQSEPMTALEAAQWLSELRRMTEHVKAPRGVPGPALQSLIELHEMAIRRVVPELPVPADSEVARIQQEKLAADLAPLKRMQVRPDAVDVAAPVVTPSESGPLDLSVI